jgi:hypothetical protein
MGAFFARCRYLVLTGRLLATLEPMNTIRRDADPIRYEHVLAATPSACFRPDVLGEWQTLAAFT